MDTLKLAVCEDSPEEREKLLAILQKSKTPLETSVFSGGEDFLRDFFPEKYDLVLMDIYMTGMTGIETVTELRKADEAVPVAFITTSTDFALESYRLDALKYIEKPVKAKAVNELLELALLKKQSIPRIELKTAEGERSIAFSKIKYLEQTAHELTVYLTGGETITLHEKLDDLAPQFEEQGFFRCHKSYLVNLAQVSAFNRELMVFTMKQGQNVHIRRESLAKARKAFEDYLFAEARRQDDE